MYLNIGLLLLRIAAAGTMLVQHGWGKLNNFSEMSTQFPSVFGMGSELSLSLAVFAEFFCSCLLLIGLFSRLAIIPLFTTMAVAFFVIHAADPFQTKELAFLYMWVYGALFMTGPGAISLQSIFKISAGRFGWLLK